MQLVIAERPIVQGGEVEGSARGRRQRNRTKEPREARLCRPLPAAGGRAQKRGRALRTWGAAAASARGTLAALGADWLRAVCAVLRCVRGVGCSLLCAGGVGRGACLGLTDVWACFAFPRSPVFPSGMSVRRAIARPWRCVRFERGGSSAGALGKSTDRSGQKCYSAICAHSNVLRQRDCAVFLAGHCSSICWRAIYYSILCSHVTSSCWGRSPRRPRSPARLAVVPLPSCRCCCPRRRWQPQR